MLLMYFAYVSNLYMQLMDLAYVHCHVFVISFDSLAFRARDYSVWHTMTHLDSECWLPNICNLHTIFIFLITQDILYCCFTSYQHLSSYPDGYRLVTVRTYGNFIVLPHWETRSPAP